MKKQSSEFQGRGTKKFNQLSQGRGACFKLGVDLRSVSDQFFGVIVSLILQMQSFEVCLELTNFLQEKLAPKCAAKQEELSGTALSAIRDFQKWLAPLSREVWNCFGNRKGIEAPHSFTLKRRQDLSPSEQAWFGHESGSQDVLDDDNSVYCCVKTYMRNTCLQSPGPILILPPGRERHAHGEPRDVCARTPMTKQRIDQLMKLKSKLQDYGLRKAADALHGLVFDRSYTLPRLNWLESGWQVDRANRGGSGNYFFPHLPASSWRLFSRDKHR